MTKRTDSSTEGNWVIEDTSRNTFNVVNTNLYANLANAEDTGGKEIDVLSNGFKVRASGTNGNINGATYIYAAFAESPFQISRAR